MGYAAVALTDLEGLAGTSFPNVGGIEDQQLYLESDLSSEYCFEGIVGKSAAIQKVLEQVSIVAPTDASVLLYGETGTGKELIARAIHNLSSRRARSYVRMNCAAIPSGLLESELFGHERGAFTGALMQRKGRLELADGGSLFLDEIGDISLEHAAEITACVARAGVRAPGKCQNHPGKRAHNCRDPSRPFSHDSGGEISRGPVLST